MPAKAKKQNATPTPKTFPGGAIIIKNIRATAIENISFRMEPKGKWFTVNKFLSIGDDIALSNLQCGTYTIEIYMEHRRIPDRRIVTLEVEVRPEVSITTIGVGLEC